VQMHCDLLIMMSTNDTCVDHECENRQTDRWTDGRTIGIRQNRR